jgi:phenylalanine-4-hydroxylase
MKRVNAGVAPVTYGTGDRPPRGDYARARSDYTCDQDYAHYGEADHGRGGLKASRLGAWELLARLYWYTVEFGLINTPQGVRAYGAGVLSSAGELRYSVTSPEPQRVAVDLRRLMRSRYKIDTFQSTSFVIDSFQQLFEATEPDFTGDYDAVRSLPEIAAGSVLPSERLFTAG